MRREILPVILTVCVTLGLLGPGRADAPLAPEHQIHGVIDGLEAGTLLPDLPARYRDHMAMFLATYQQTRLAGPEYEDALRLALLRIGEECHEAIKARAQQGR